MESVGEYRYLGIVIKRIDNSNTTLSNQANKTMFSLLKVVPYIFQPMPSLMCHLFDCLVCPVEEYDSEIWEVTQAEECATVHCYFLQINHESTKKNNLLWGIENHIHVGKKESYSKIFKKY